MNTEKKIDQFLRAVPKPPAPDGLLDKLQADISAGDIKTQRSVLHRWFAPTGGPISFWRVAAAAAITILVLLPLTYAGGKIIKTYIFTEGPKVEVIENEDGSVTKIGSISVATNASGEQPNEEEAKEIEELRNAGKFEEEFVQEWVKDGFTFRLYKVSYTLSSGKVITVNEVVGSHD
jgi:hypothetical protein